MPFDGLMNVIIDYCADRYMYMRTEIDTFHMFFCPITRMPFDGLIQFSIDSCADRNIIQPFCFC